MNIEKAEANSKLLELSRQNIDNVKLLIFSLNILINKQMYYIMSIDI